MRWIQSLLRTLGNDGAIRNVQRELDRRTAIVAHVEALALKLALIDATPAASVTAEAA